MINKQIMGYKDVKMPGEGSHEHSAENRKVVRVVKFTKSGKEGIVLLDNGDYKFGDLIFYPEGECFYREGIRIDVPNLECKLVRVLLESEHCNLKRKKIIEALWPNADSDCNDNLNSTVWRLKRDLKEIGAILIVESERGKGYELCVKDDLDS